MSVVQNGELLLLCQSECPAAAVRWPSMSAPPRLSCRMDIVDQHWIDGTCGRSSHSHRYRQARKGRRGWHLATACTFHNSTVRTNSSPLVRTRGIPFAVAPRGKSRCRWERTGTLRHKDGNYLETRKSCLCILRDTCGCMLSSLRDDYSRSIRKNVCWSCKVVGPFRRRHIVGP